MGNGSQIVSAVILGIAVLAAGFVVSSSLDVGTEELAGVRTALVEVRDAFEQAAGVKPQRPTAQPGSPDPADRTEVRVDGAPTLGPDAARVKIVEFSDFQCPFCGRVWPTLQKIREQYGDDVQLVFKHLPLRIHPQAPEAHAAAEAAHRQGKFWEMHNAIFENPRELKTEKYLEYARQIGLDVERFQQDLASESVKQRVEADVSEAQELGISGTPSFFINGRFFSGAQPLEAFKKRIDEELARG